MTVKTKHSCSGGLEVRKQSSLLMLFKHHLLSSKYMKPKHATQTLYRSGSPPLRVHPHLCSRPSPPPPQFCGMTIGCASGTCKHILPRGLSVGGKESASPVWVRHWALGCGEQVGPASTLRQLTVQWERQVIGKHSMPGISLHYP